MIAEFLAAAVSGLIGTQWGATVLLSGLLQGLGVEFALGLFVFKVFNVYVAALGGALAAAFETLYEWDAYWGGSSKTLDVHVAAVRRKILEAAGSARAELPEIVTIRGYGYRLELAPDARSTLPS